MWNPKAYDRFSAERRQPSVDLAARLSDRPYRRILDVGCASGLSTEVLHEVWPEAEIIGVDLSPTMLEEARRKLPSVRFIERDCSKPLDDLGMFDLVFSNAFIQWIPNPGEFITGTYAMLTEGGALAIQVPLFQDMPAHAALLHALSDIGMDKNAGAEKIYRKPWVDYYTMMSGVSDVLSLWTTDYIHQMPDVDSIYGFMESTALHPYLELMDDDLKSRFHEILLGYLEKAYPIQANGTVLFPFRRFFIIAEKSPCEALS